MKLALSFVTGLMLTLYAMSSALHSEEFPQATAISEKSLREGFPVQALPKLMRGAILDESGASDILLQKLCPNCSRPKPVETGISLQMPGDRWSLEISGRGTAGQFQDYSVAERQHSLAIPEDKKPSNDNLEKYGQEVIKSLGTLIALGPEEEIFPLYSNYLIEGGQDVKSSEITRSVIANRIAFGRSIRGVPIVGGGSRVILTFANDNTLASFWYDWPQYKAESTLVRVVDTQEILRRIRIVVGSRTNAPALPEEVAAPDRERATYPFALSKDLELQSLECGYYDPGAAARETEAPVQPGCVYHVVAKGSRGIRAGFAGAVPAGVEIEADAGWPEAVILRGPQPSDKPSVPGGAANPL
jgi:hypothetical protein